jgi:phenylacetate-CoA ligase
LRQIPADRFHAEFCVPGHPPILEYWRSGGATGRPLFYPRSALDLDVSWECWRRLWTSAGCGAGDSAHIAFPLGIHPVGLLYMRSAQMLGIATVAAGAGNNTPSELQVELILNLRPTVLAGMASYALQLAQVAERKGIDLARAGVRKIITAAEPLSRAKRERLQRSWGAEVFDQFGCTEGSALAVESDRHDGLHVWDDLFHFEVVDERGQPVPEGQVGTLCMTPLYSNTITPFLRWNTGDYVVWQERGGTAGPLAHYPMFKHTARTTGFFKVRGVNINHGDFEDFMYGVDAVADFKLEAHATDTLDELVLTVEMKPGAGSEAGRALIETVKRRFEVTPRLVPAEPGAIAREFLSDVKANRFKDLRGA